jgi:hypothetical protein
MAWRGGCHARSSGVILDESWPSTLMSRISPVHVLITDQMNFVTLELRDLMSWTGRFAAHSNGPLVLMK